MEIQINKSAWEKLPLEYQEIVKTAAMEANLNMLSQYDALNREAFQRLSYSGTQFSITKVLMIKNTFMLI